MRQSPRTSTLLPGGVVRELFFACRTAAFSPIESRQDNRIKTDCNRLVRRVRRLSILAALTFIGYSTLLVANATAAGVTIVTHGYQYSPIDEAHGWVEGMGDDIAARAGNTPYVYRMQIINVPDGGFNTLNLQVGSFTCQNSSLPNLVDSNNAEIVIKLYWDTIADKGTNGSSVNINTTAIAKVVVDNLASLSFGPFLHKNLAELPFHLIGHSRGGSLVCEMARLLGQRGIWVDQVTTLDPHPVTSTAPVDGPASIYENVLFADNYWREDGYDVSLDPDGQSVDGAYNRKLADHLLSYGGYANVTSVSVEHSNLHLWYFGTVGLGTPASDGNAVLTNLERMPWYTFAESSGSRNGFYYSRLGSGDRQSDARPGDGVSPDAIYYGYYNYGNFNAYPTNRAHLSGRIPNQWPNVVRVSCNASGVIAAGGALPFNLVYQSVDSPVRVTLYLDPDKNPYNDNGIAVWTQSYGATGYGTPTVDTFATIPTSMAAGTYNVYARIDGTSSSYTRYMYAGNTVIVTASQNPAAPSGLTAKAASPGQVDLGWRDNSNNESGFRIYRSTRSGGPFTTAIGTVGSNATSFSDKNCAASTTYYYIVKAYNGSVESGSSNSANAPTLSVSSSVTRALTVASSNPASGGYITSTPNSTTGASDGTTPFTRTYYDGTSVTLVAPATAGGNSFLRWQIDGQNALSGNICNVGMNANHTVTAVFGTQTATLTSLQVSGPASVNANSSATYSATATFSDGSTAPVTPVWSVNSSVAHVSSGGVLDAGAVSADTPITVNGTYTLAGATRSVSKNVTILHTSTSPAYTLTVSYDSSRGRVEQNPKTSQFAPRSGVTLTAFPADGYVFTNWTGDSLSSLSSLPLTMDSDKTVVANFAPVVNQPKAGLTVTILPPEAVAAGAGWRFSGGALQTSGSTFFTPVAGDYSIQFTSVPGFDSPGEQFVTMVPGQNQSRTVTYKSNAVFGSAQVILAPQAAIDAGAQWRLDSGSWQNSGAVVSGLSEANHTIDYRAVAGWVSPISQTVSVVGGQTQIVNGSYTPVAGVPAIYSISPKNGPLAGGTAVTITGANFLGPMAVTFDGIAATAVSVQSASQVTAIAPPRSAYGSVAVTVTASGGTATNPNGFTYTIPRGTNLDLIGQIGGAVKAITIAGNYAYIGEGASLAILDLSNPIQPSKVGSVLMPGVVFKIAISGSYAYVAAADGGLQVVDISTKNAPLLVGYFSSSNAASICTSGTTAYLVDSVDGLYVLDITKPSAPSLVTKLALGGEATSSALGSNGGGSFLYVGIRNSGLQIVDVTSPASPRLRGTFGTLASPRDIAVNGTQVFVANNSGSDEVVVINAQNPDSPTRVGTMQNGGYGVWGLAMQGTHCYVAADSQLLIFDSSNPASLRVTGGSAYGTLGSQNTSNSQFGSPVAVSGNYAYVADLAEGVKVFNISDPTRAPQTAVYSGIGTVTGGFLSGTTVYAACQTHGLQIVDVTNPANPVRQGSYVLNNPPNPPGAIQDLAYGGGQVYLHYNGLPTIGVADPNNPTLVGHFDGPSGQDSALPYAILANGTSVWEVATGSGSSYKPDLYYVDLSVPASPVIRSSLILDQTGIDIRGLSVRGGLAVIPRGEAHGMYVVDVSAPAAPVARALFSSPGIALGADLSKDGKVAYLADNQANIQIIDLSHPSSPQLVGAVNMGVQVPFNCTVIGDILMVGGSWGVFVYDITTPAQPVELARYHTPAAASKVMSDGRTIYVPTAGAGLTILSLRNTQAPVVTITNPVSSTNQSSLTLSGSTTDNDGVVQVNWSNNRGGGGVASGTSSWSISNIPLAAGSNIITLTAIDISGNTTTTTLTVTSTPPDSTPPQIVVTSPTTNASYGTLLGSLALTGTATDDTGVTQVAWANDRGGSGIASGTGDWSISGIVLYSGDNVITVTAQDATGNTVARTLTTTYTPPDSASPSVTIVTPTIGATLETPSNAIDISGLASDDTAVTQVTWANDRGGDGFATGTTAWSVGEINLQIGANVITVTAQDASGNSSTDALVVTYTPPLPDAPVVNSGSTMSATQGQPVSYQITATNAPVSFDATGLPPLLGVNPATGLISGTPTVAGTFNIAISAANAGGSGPATLSLTVSPATSPTPMPTPSASPTPIATPTPSTSPTPFPVTLGNISTRLSVGMGDNVLIGGFIVSGTQPKKVLIRALGPSLPLGGALANPTLELYSGQTIIESNDNWVDSANKQAIIDTTIPPTNDLESAIVATLPANNSAYTAIVRGAGGGAGVGLVEVYDLDATVDSKLANISTRGFVQTGNNVLIGGLIVQGTTSAKVIIRGIGPSLQASGVANPLPDPTLSVFDGNGVQVATNDNWPTDPGAAEMQAYNLAPSDPKEAATLQTLAPGNYTAIVSGVNDTTGVGLVEVYNVQ